MSQKITSTTKLLQEQWTEKTKLEPQIKLQSAASDMPLKAPLNMPEQDFAVRPPLVHDRPVAWKTVVRRFIFVGGSLAMASISSYGLLKQFVANGICLLDLPFVLAFFVLDWYYSLRFTSSFFGFCVLLRTPQKARSAKTDLPTQRTAVLVPIYNEDMDGVYRRLRSMMKSIDEIEAGNLFDFFLLSDSNAAAEETERAVVAKLRVKTHVALYYRRRPKNIAHKPGNIADWVENWGAAYEKMVVFDADSVMTGVVLAKLAFQMEAQPAVGLIQATSAFNGGNTLYSRWQQFDSAVYVPLQRAGLVWWAGNDATYWGHNAIIRTRAFAESCGLPELSGPRPSGGHIMSHDG